MKKLIFAVGIIAMSLTAMACNHQKDEKSENVKSIARDIEKVEEFVDEASKEEVLEKMNKRSYALGASMGMNAHFQFGDLGLNNNEIKDAIVDFYLNGDTESEELRDNSMKFQQFIYTRVYPYMQAKHTYDTMVEGGMTENLPELPVLFDEEYSKEFITKTLGSQMGASLIDVDGLEMGWLFKGFNDVLAIDTKELMEMEDYEEANTKMESYLLLTTKDMQTEIMTLQQEMQKKAMEERKKAMEERQKELDQAKAESEEWLAEIEKMEGVQKTESGLLYRIDRVGNDVYATADEDTVEVNYEGKTRNGNIFDSSYERGESIEFPLNHVIKGWTEGMKLISEGGQITLWIHPDMAYGERGAGEDIGPNEALEFKVELIRVLPAQVITE